MISRTVTLATLLLSVASAFYLPGIAPTEYEEAAPMSILANKLVSTQNVVPYDFYSLPFCAPKDPTKSSHLSVGQVLMGERAERTTYDISMRLDESCKILCTKDYDAKDIKLITSRVTDDYNARLNLDNLPVIVRGTNELNEDVFELGYPVGRMDGKVACLFNHLKFTVRYHKPTGPIYNTDNDAYRVVGFEVYPMSVEHKKDADGQLTTCPVNGSITPACLTGSSASVTYTYDVEFKESPLQWATRWDPLLKANPELREIQWFSVINSLMISLFLTAMVAMILLRTVYLDFARYNNIDDEEEIQEESGWKLIHGDVFRPPALSGLLSVLVGSGAQILVQTGVTLVFALLGFLSPSFRGGLLTTMLSLWVLSSVFCGYYSARIYSGLGGTNKKSVTLGSAFLFSGSAFILFFALNFILWVSGSTGAVPFFTLLLILVMWFGISVPLNVIGAFFGYKQKAYEFPVRTNQIPREIPNSSTFSHVLFGVFSGILPFGVVFMELVFILNSIWLNKIYYFFGFLGAVFLILLVTCAEVSIVLTYLQLSKESYHWWWPAFISTASSGIYVFGYSLVFLFTQPDLQGIHVVSTMIYTGYMLLGALMFSLATGCVGFLSSFAFVRKIYASVHID
ncbi:Transmembrane 9 superfamily member 7 [Gracilariopsis chorda]|uniref:Transmembrane 9 superfamily member n=1 Tax=Gracilariopsis chorda TaxID=448386 RepID=A0A2V3IQM3_9FLOR|nr:Transmembrane 9 superfamily member 7 [Gracilariopsis chorda]|eukprot:PXF44383.1 Transmembrane 9 superfamily member 7 [Gracilariopsis chorda]